MVSTPSPFFFRFVWHLINLDYIKAWLVAAFTFERLIVVRYPLKRPVICTVRRAKVIIGSLTIAILIVQTISLFTTDVIKIRLVGSRWRELMPYINKAMHIFNIFESFLTQVVPPVLIVVMNGFIIHGLACLNQTFQAGSNKHRSSSVSANHSHCRKITSIRVSSADAACQAQKLRILYSYYFL